LLERHAFESFHVGDAAKRSEFGRDHGHSDAKTWCCDEEPERYAIAGAEIQNSRT
jgi:hypothetical protein